MSSIYVTNCTPKCEPVVFHHDFEVYQDDPDCYDRLTAWAFDAGHQGRISIVDRRTGFGHRDIETGFRDTYAMVARGRENYGKNFWLASGQFDIRNHIPADGLTWDEAVYLIKFHSNTCVGVEDDQAL